MVSPCFLFNYLFLFSLGMLALTYLIRGSSWGRLLLVSLLYLEWSNSMGISHYIGFFSQALVNKFNRFSTNFQNKNQSILAKYATHLPPSTFIVGFVEVNNIMSLYINNLIQYLKLCLACLNNYHFSCYLWHIFRIFECTIGGITSYSSAISFLLINFFIIFSRINSSKYMRGFLLRSFSKLF